MARPKAVVFDFDGTIANTFNAIIEIYNEIAPKFNCRKIDENEIEFLKNKRPQEMMQEYNVSYSKLPLLVIKGRKLLKLKIEKIEPYHNIREALTHLKSNNIELGILTSNSRHNISKFLKQNQLNSLIDFIYTGHNLFGKSKIIKRMLKKRSLKSSDILYVGDETRDIEATKKMNIPILSVTWGFNTKEVLASLNPDFLAENPMQMVDIIQHM